MTKCWLYIYENPKQRQIYIGIGDSMQRVFGGHNEEATALRDAPGTRILQTLEPFSSRKDARKAEAIAIHVAALAGYTTQSLDENEQLVTTNRAGVYSTGELGPAIYTTEGTIDGTELQDTVVVGISAEDLNGELAPFGANDASAFAPRAARWWRIAEWKRPRIKQLIAVLKGSGGLILGSWEVTPDAEWERIPDYENRPSSYKYRVAIPLKDPSNDNYGDIKGKRLVNHRLNVGATYSPDLR